MTPEQALDALLILSRWLTALAVVTVLVAAVLAAAVWLEGRDERRDAVRRNQGWRVR